MDFSFPIGFPSAIYRSLFVSYMTDIFCIRIHICKIYFFPILLFLRWKAKDIVLVLILEKVLFAP